MRDMTEQELFNFYDHGQCPNCFSKDFLEGPHGGSMVNIECDNCKMRLNVSQGGWHRTGQVLFAPTGYHTPIDAAPAVKDATLAATPLEETQVMPEHDEQAPKRHERSSGRFWICIAAIVFGTIAAVAALAALFQLVPSNLPPLILAIGASLGAISAGTGIHLLHESATQ